MLQEPLFPPSRVKLNYDSEADVLYLSLGNSVPAEGEMRNGVIFRYSLIDDAPVGATVVAFRKRWQTNLADLAVKLANVLPMQSQDLEKILARKAFPGA